MSVGWKCSKMVWAVVIAGCTGACAGHSTDQGGTSSGGVSSGGVSSGGVSGGGTGATSGLGGFSGAAVVPQGGLTISLFGVQGSRTACPATGFTYQIGAPDSPTVLSPGLSLVSGQNGSAITCSVTGQGQFSFSGSLHATTAHGDAVSINFSNGSVASDDSGSADVAVYSPQLAATYSGTACSVLAIQQQVKPGVIWASFECPQINSPPSGQCGLNGVVVFENCDGS